MGVYNFLAPFDQVECLAFDDVLSPKYVDEYIGKVAVLQIGSRDLEVVLPRGVVLQIDVQVMGFCSVEFSKVL